MDVTSVTDVAIPLLHTKLHRPRLSSDLVVRPRLLEILDPAALIGVVTTLYELHLPVLLVKCLTFQASNDR